MIQGLQAMHKAGIAHRDLKPENLLFDNQYNLKIADFGFSYVYKKGEGPKTSMRTELGTKGYMAPEILSNKKYTEKADIFASGVILFIMLAGFPPFQNAVAKDWWFDKLQKKKYKLFWMAHERTAKFSSEAKDILQKMLAPNEADRHSVETVQQSKFYLKKCLTKDEMANELKKRKQTVDAEKAKETTNRDTLLEIVLPKEGLLPDSKPILLKSLLQNKVQDGLLADKTKNGMIGTMMDLFDKKEAQDDLRDKIKKVPDAQVAEIAQKLANSASSTAEELIKNFPELELNKQLAEKIIAGLRETKLGQLDDWNIVQKFAQIEATKLPEWFPFRTKAHAYKTKMSFGLLGYCVQKFITDKGQMTVDTTDSSISLYMVIQKKVVLPDEKDGEVVWRAGKMPVKVKVLIRLYYDEPSKSNVLTFENISASHMGMKEYVEIVNEIVSNRKWLLGYFLESHFEQSDKDLENTDWKEFSPENLGLTGDDADLEKALQSSEEEVQSK